MKKETKLYRECVTNKHFQTNCYKKKKKKENQKKKRISGFYFLLYCPRYIENKVIFKSINYRRNHQQ